MNVFKLNYLNTKISLGNHRSIDSLNAILDLHGIDAFNSKQLSSLMKTLNGLLLDAERFNRIIGNYVTDDNKAKEFESSSISDLIVYLREFAKSLDQNSPKAYDVYSAIDYLRNANSSSPGATKLLNRLTALGAYRNLEPLDAHQLLTRYIEDGTSSSYALIEDAFNNGALELLSPVLRSDLLLYLKHPSNAPCKLIEMSAKFPAIAKAVKGLDGIEVRNLRTKPMSDLRFSLLKHRLKFETPESFERLVMILRREGIDTFSRDHITRAMLMCSEAKRNEGFAQQFMHEAIEKGAIQRMDPSSLYVFIQNLFMKFDLPSFNVITDAANHGAVPQMGPRLAMTTMVHFRFSMPSFNGKGKHPSSALPLTAMIKNGGLEVLTERGSFDSYFANVDSFNNEDFHAAYGTALALKLETPSTSVDLI